MSSANHRPHRAPGLDAVNDSAPQAPDSGVWPGNEPLLTGSAASCPTTAQGASTPEMRRLGTSAPRIARAILARQARLIALAWMASLRYAASPGRMFSKYAVNRSIRHVHVGQPGVDLVRALVEPAADQLPVLLGQLRRRRAVGRRARVHDGGDAPPPLLVLGLDAQPVLLRVAGGAPGRLLVRLGVAPALLRLLGVRVRVEVAEDLEPLLRASVGYPSFSPPSRVRSRRPSPAAARSARSAARAAGAGAPPGPRPGRRGSRRSPRAGTPAPGSTGCAAAAPGPRRRSGGSPRRAAAGREQPDLVVVVQRPHRHPGRPRHLTHRVRHRFPPFRDQAPACRYVRVKPDSAGRPGDLCAERDRPRSPEGAGDRGRSGRGWSGQVVTRSLAFTGAANASVWRGPEGVQQAGERQQEQQRRGEVHREWRPGRPWRRTR